MTKNEENKAVKSALLANGIDVLRVGHGRGTSSWWLEIELARPLEFACEQHGSQHTWDRQDCNACQDFAQYMRVITQSVVAIAQKATGRHGDYDGRMSVSFAS